MLYVKKTKKKMSLITEVIFHPAIYGSRLPEDKWTYAKVKLFFSINGSRLL